MQQAHISYRIYENSGFERLKELDNLDPIVLDTGKKEMKKHKLLIMGITGDNAKHLINTIKHIEHTGSFFADYRVILFENDSKDRTKEILKNWSIDNNKIKVISKDFGNKKRPNIQFLADARNFYLEEMNYNNEYKDFDILMIIDLDMRYGWDMRGIFHSFGLINEWDAVCSNGLIKNKMYDAFAFRSQEFPYNNQHPDYTSEIIPKIQKIYKTGEELVHVYSCFGGMAFYKKEFVGNCKYLSKDGDCEHVDFNSCIRKNGGRIVMNPSQIIIYQDFRRNHSIDKHIYKVKCWINNLLKRKQKYCY